MKKHLVAFALALVGCTSTFRVTTPIPVVVMGDEQLHQAACDTPSALCGCGGPALGTPRVVLTPTAGPTSRHVMAASFPASIPLSSLQQGGATSTQVLTWSGSAWAPAPGGGGSSPTGTGVALVSGGSFVGAAGPVDLSSSTYVANALGMVNGGFGANLSSCTPGMLLQIASGPVASCNTSSGDITYAAGGAGTVGKIGGGLWSASVAGGGIYAGYTLLVANASTSGVVFGQAPPVSDVATTPTVISGSNAYASSSTHTTGGDLDLYGGTGATSNGTPGNVNAYIPAATGTGTEGAFRVLRSTQPYAYLGPWALNTAYSALTMGPNITPSGSSIVNANYTILVSSAQTAFGSPGAFDWYGDGTHLSTWSGGTGEIQFGFNVAIGTTGGGNYGGGTNTEYIANGTRPSSACTGGSCVDSDSAGLLVHTDSNNNQAAWLTGYATLAPTATQTLSAAQSTVSMLQFTGTTASAVTSALTPAQAKGSLLFIRNADTSTVTFGWSTGTTCSLVTVTSALVTSDGTNCVILLKGT